MLVEDNKQQQGKAGTRGGLTILTCVKVALFFIFFCVLIDCVSQPCQSATGQNERGIQTKVSVLDHPEHFVASFTFHMFSV